MTLLLDTHAFLWWLADDRRLSSAARSAVASSTSVVYVSAASIWEIAIKASIGKLRLATEDRARLGGLVAECGFREIAVTAAHAAGVLDLPLHHADPFDRILVAQALAEGLTIVTGDPAFSAYGVSVFAP
jgi:PIN domain nuclease of toxin-antitoxin system